MWGPGLSKPPTQRGVWAILVWLSTTHKPPNMSGTHGDHVYCVVHICQTLMWAPRAINLDRRWKPMSIFETLKLSVSTCKKGLYASPEYIVIQTPKNDKAMWSRHQPLDIPQDCVMGQGAIYGSYCLFLPTSLRVTYITYDMCIMHLWWWILTDTI